MKMAESYPPLENTVGKGEIARYEQFLLLPQCFQMACFRGTSKGVVVWEWVNPSLIHSRRHRCTKWVEGRCQAGD